MRSDWRDSDLGSEVDLLAGYAFKSRSFSESSTDMRLLRGDNVAQGSLRWGGAKRWSPDALDGLGRYSLELGDVILAMDRPWIDAGLKYAWIRGSDLPCLLVQRVARIRGGSRLDQTFLRYLIGSPQFTEHVLAVQTGTAVPHISGSQISAFKFKLPALREQRRIAGVLGALDDKIEHNLRLGKQLERLAALEGRRLVAQAERVFALSDVASFVNGRAISKEANGRGRPILRIRELNSGIDDSTLRSDIAVPDDYVARHFDLLFAWSGSLDVYRWVGPESLINQHIFKVIPREPFPLWLVEFWLREHLPEFRAIAGEKATTMGHIQRHHLDEAVVRVPNEPEMVRSRCLLDPTDSLRSSLSRQTTRLRELRDELLPKLVSGRIRVPDSYDPDDVLGTLAESAGAAV